MNTYDVTIGANGVFELIGRARFLRLMTSTGPVDIEYYSAGRVIARADGVEAGYAEEFDGQGFDRVRVSADPGVTIKAVMRESGRVAYDRGASTADVLSMPAVKIAAGQSVAVESLPDGVVRTPIGSMWSGVNGLAGPLPLIAPAANTGGAIIRTAWINGSSLNLAGLIAATGAPDSAQPSAGEFPVLFANDRAAVTLTREIYLPPGMGLYIAPWVAGDAVHGSCSYDLLP